MRRRNRRNVRTSHAKRPFSEDIFKHVWKHMCRRDREHVRTSHAKRLILRIRSRIIEQCVPAKSRKCEDVSRQTPNFEHKTKNKTKRNNYNKNVRTSHAKRQFVLKMLFLLLRNVCRRDRENVRTFQAKRFLCLASLIDIAQQHLVFSCYLSGFPELGK